MVAGKVFLLTVRKSIDRGIHMDKCPVCGEKLYEGREEQIVTLYQGKNYHFCSTDHRDEFEEQPGKYV